MKKLLSTLSECCAVFLNRPAAKHLSVSFFSNKLGAYRYLVLVIALWGSTSALLAQPTWTGAMNSNWNMPGNWMPAAVPIATSDVIIPDVTNDPVITGGTAAVAQSVKIASGATLTIQNSASLSIEGDADYAIYNEGIVSNSGTITIGATASPGFYGIQNLGTFNNNVDANITINRGSIGINHATGTFSNAGTIKIGDVASLNSTGVYNEADFQNLATGILEISRTSGSGFYNLATGTLTNAGTITLGKEASINGPAFYNFNKIENKKDATINIDRTNVAIDNRTMSTFINEGAMSIGTSFAISNSGIYMQGSFKNQGGNILIDQINSVGIIIHSNGSFTNTTTDNNDPNNGKISISRTGSNGIIIEIGCSFTNESNLSFGENNNSNIGGVAIDNLSTFDNKGGILSINRANRGIQSGFSSNNQVVKFINTGNIYIGNLENGKVQGVAIDNYIGTFENKGGNIFINRAVRGIQNFNRLALT